MVEFLHLQAQASLTEERDAAIARVRQADSTMDGLRRRTAELETRVQVSPELDLSEQGGKLKKPVSRKPEECLFDKSGCKRGVVEAEKGTQGFAGERDKGRGLLMECCLLLFA